MSYVLNGSCHQTVRFDHVNLSHGLSNNSILSIVEDYQGFVWIGTEDGLNRYNGYEVEVFQHSSGDPFSISNSYAFSMLEDSQNRLWIGTHYGLNRYDRSLGKFSSIIFSEIDTTFPHDPFIHTIAEDYNGNIWAGTHTGLYLIHPDKESFTHYSFLNGNSIILEILGYNSDYLIIGTEGLGLYLFNIHSGTFKEIALPGYEVINRSHIYSLFKDSKQRLWVGLRGQGLAVLCPDLQVLKFITKNDGLVDNHIFSIYEDGYGSFWIGTDGGVSVINSDLNVEMSYTDSESDLSNLSSNVVNVVQGDNQGNIWLGTRFGGINVYYRYKQKFPLYQYAPNQDNSLTNDNVSGFSQTSEGYIWVATDGGALNCFDPETNSFIPVNLQPGHNFSNNKLIAVSADRYDNIWLGYWDGGIDYYNPTKGTVTNYSVGSNPKGLTTDYIFTFTFSSDGTLWVGSWKGGVLYYSYNKDQFTRLRPSSKPTALDNTIVNHIFEDLHNNLWIATQNNGLFIYNQSNDSIIHYTFDRQSERRITVNSVNCVMQDSKERVWLGTAGGGLELFQPYDSTFINYGVEHGLPASTIYGILEDNQGDIWLSTSYGLARITLSGDKYKPEMNVFTFDSWDGLQSNQFSLGAFFRASDGRLLFGGVNGFNAFTSDDIKLNEEPPSVLITDFQLFNRTVTPLQEDSPLSKCISETDRIVLKHDQSIISFRFTALNFINSEKNSYAYYLDPFEKDWNYAGSRREVTYTNLNPGTYTLRVKASNNDGVWNEIPRELELVILPPWWKTMWFRIALVVLFLSTIFLVFKLRMRFFVNQQKQLQKLVKQRTEELGLANRDLLEKQQEIIQQNEEIISQYEEIQTQKDTLEDRNNALQYVNEQLNDYRNNLEGIVEQRTIELSEAKAKAEESDRLKTAFLANISHEIRTPLNAIVGFTDIICDPEVDLTEKHNTKNVIKNNSEHLLQIIEDIIDISRLEAGQMEVELHEISLGKLFQQVQEYAPYELQGKEPGEINVKFYVEVPDELKDFTFKTDLKRLYRVFYSLIDNAYKYTPRGDVRVGCTLNTDLQELVFFVKDTGIGIKPENIEKIFRRFNKIEQGETTLYRGLGIGLTLVKPLVEFMGGRIWVESVLKQGSTFFFSHPTNSDEVGKRPIADSMVDSDDLKKLRGLRVLLVEDESSNMLLLERFLTKKGMVIIKAWNGQEALDVLGRSVGVGMILMDLKMPVMDGFEAYRIIKKKYPTIPVIAQTALVLADEIELIRTAGFSDFITKPINFPRLLSVMATHARY